MNRKVQILSVLAAILGLAGVVVAVAPGSVFDLDGNSILDHGTLPDWNLLNGTTGFNGSAGGSLIRTFVASENPPKIFTQGGSKDPNNTTAWVWKAADTVPDKDTITNAYAAEYLGAGSHEIFVFGGERFATNGDSNIGIWFFQQNIGPLNDSSFGPGQHVNGDIFAVSAFTNGGVNPTISVYKWNTACTRAAGKKLVPAIVNGVVTNHPPNTCADSNLELQFASAAGSSCVLGSSDTACAATNSTGPVTVSWPYAAKFGGAANTVPAAGFFEGGIDVTELFGGIPGNEPCISSFLLETRSSAEPSATNKDFISGGFNTCGEIEVHKDCACTSVTSDGNNFSYNVSGTVTNTGAISPLYDVTVVDASAGLTCPIGTVNPGPPVAWGNGSAHPCFVTGTQTQKNFFLSTQKPASDSATVTWSRTSGGTTLGPNSSGNVTCDSSAAACVVNPALSVTKTCTVATVVVSGRIQLRVDFSGTVTNNTTNAPLHNVSVCDDDDQTVPPGTFTCDQTFTIGDLAAGEQKSFNGSYFPSNLIPVEEGRLIFYDTVKATGSSTLGGSVTSDPATAHCVVCPPGSAACPAPPGQ